MLKNRPGPKGLAFFHCIGFYTCCQVNQNDAGYACKQDSGGDDVKPFSKKCH